MVEKTTISKRTMTAGKVLLMVALAVGLLTMGASGAMAAENEQGPDDNNKNWGDNAGNSDNAECTTGHGNPASGNGVNGVADDCGQNRGEA